LSGIDKYIGTVCMICGGSGEITEPSDRLDDSFDLTTETEACDNCAGTGWEPPEDEDD
jgi:hypothetical protein